MKHCFGYVRVSTVKQGDGVSLEAQKDAIMAFADRSDITIIKWFEEKETAAKKGRPIFNQLVRELKRGKASGVVIHKIDRSARNFADWAKIGDLSDAGIDIHFATESLDFKSRGGRLTADIQAVIAADYIRNLREECIKGMNGRLKQGLYPWAAPLGYLDNGGGKAKTPDPVRAPLIKKLFELYASGNYSLWSIVPEVERIGLRNHRNNPLSKTTIEKILRNPFYAGVIAVRSSSQVYAGIHKPIVSVELFEAVKAVREGRDNKKSTKHNHRYRGMFRCGYCNGAMIPELQKQKVYYRCHKLLCATKSVRQKQLETNLLKVLQSLQLSQAQTATLRINLTKYIEQSNANEDADRAPLELAKLKQRLMVLTDKLVDEVIDEAIYLEKKKSILLEQKRWEGLQKKRSQKAAKLRQIDPFIERVKSLYSSYQLASGSLKRQIAKIATSNRFVFGKNIEIEPQKWVCELENMLNPAWCEHPKPTNRICALDELLEMSQKLKTIEKQNSKSH